jgi:hypothetical protein
MSAPGAPNMIGTLEPFGRTDLEDIEEWLMKYEAVTTMNNWKQVIKAKQVAVFLVGTARVWYEALPVEVKNDYAVLAGRLGAEFTHEQKNNHLWTLVRNKKQMSYESVNDYVYCGAVT